MIANAPPPKQSSPVQDILSGTAGGIAQVLVGHPLDTVKVRMQAQEGANMVSVLKEGFKNRNLYAGASSPLIGKKENSFFEIVLTIW